MPLEINFKEDKSRWDEFVKASPQATIFGETRFLDSLSIQYDLVTCSKNNKIEIGAILLRDKDGAIIRSPHPFTQSQGIFLAQDPGKSIQSQTSSQFKNIECLINNLESNYGEFLLVNSWRLGDMRPFLWHNFYEPEGRKFALDLRYTAVIDLTAYASMGEYIASVRQCRRQELKKLKNLITIKSSNEIDILEVLHEKTFARQGLCLKREDINVMRGVCQNALNRGYGRLKIARLDDVPIAACFFINDDSTAYYLIGASDPEFRKLSAGTGLMFSMIEEFFQENIKNIDVVGVNSPNRGDYKISFNAEIKPYYITSCR